MQIVKVVRFTQGPADELLAPRTDHEETPLAPFAALVWGTVVSLPFWIVVTAWLLA